MPAQPGPAPARAPSPGSPCRGTATVWGCSLPSHLSQAPTGPPPPPSTQFLSVPDVLLELNKHQKIFAIKILISSPLVPGTDRSSQSCCGHTVVSVLRGGMSPERPSPPEWRWRLGDPRDRDCNVLMENLYPLLPSSMGTFLNLEPLLLEPLAPARLLSHSADQRPISLLPFSVCPHGKQTFLGQDCPFWSGSTCKEL